MTTRWVLPKRWLNMILKLKPPKSNSRLGFTNPDLILAPNRSFRSPLEAAPGSSLADTSVGAAGAKYAVKTWQRFPICGLRDSLKMRPKWGTRTCEEIWRTFQRFAMMCPSNSSLDRDLHHEKPGSIPNRKDGEKNGTKPPAARSPQSKVVPCCGRAPRRASRRLRDGFEGESPSGLFLCCDDGIALKRHGCGWHVEWSDWEGRSVWVHSWGLKVAPYRAFQRRDERKSKQTSKL